MSQDFVDDLETETKVGLSQDPFDNLEERASILMKHTGNTGQNPTMSAPALQTDI